jgi:hypothetical protein
VTEVLFNLKKNLKQQSSHLRNLNENCSKENLRSRENAIKIEKKEQFPLHIWMNCGHEMKKPKLILSVDIFLFEKHYFH